MNATTCLHGVSLLTILIVGGCKTAEVQPVYDSVAAEQTLTAALEAWKAGTAGVLAKQASPIYFEDDDFRNGLKLVDFRFDRSTAPFGPFKNVPVKLKMRDRGGQLVEQSVNYQIALEPKRTVLRGD